MSVHPAGSLPFVGRAEESALLDDALEAARDGHLVTVLVTGETGIGKTALARSFVTRVALSGIEVHWGSCRELNETPPLWPWMQVMRSMGEGDIGGVALESRPNDPFAVMDGVTAMLRARPASAQVIVLDDLHAADLGSLELLRHVTTMPMSSPTLILATCDLNALRNDAERDVIVGDVARNALRVDLAELSAQDITALVRARMDRGDLRRGAAAGTSAAGSASDVPDDEIAEVAAMVTDRSGGNALFARALIEALHAADGDGARRLPPSIRAAVRARLAVLPDAARELLSIAAVLTPAFDGPTIGRIAGRTTEELNAQLEAAVAAGIIDDEGDRYRFQHKMIREVLGEELNAPLRRLAHLRLAREIEHIGTELVPAVSRSSLVAENLLRAGELVAPDDTAAWLDRAVADARRVRAHADAANWGEQAAVHWRRAGDVEREAEALAGVVADHLATGAGDAALAKVAELADLARRRDDGPLLARAALARAEVFDPDLDVGGAALLQEALAHPANQGPSDERARLLSELAALVGMPSIEGMPRDQATAGAALDELRRTPATVVPAVGTLLASAQLNVGSGPVYFADRQRWFHEAFADRSARMPDQLKRAYWATSLAFERGDLPAVESHVAAWVKLAERSDSVFWQWRAATAKASLAYARGRFGDAEQLAAEALPLVSNLYPAMAFRVYAGLLFAVRRDQGRLGELAEELMRFAAERRGFADRLDGHGLSVLVPVVALETGDVEAARQTMGAVMAAAGEGSPADLHWLCLMTVIAVCADGVGDPAMSRQAADELTPFADQFVMWGRSYVPGGPVSLSLGIAERGAGDSAAAAAAFRSALAWEGSAHAPAFAARAEVGLASVLDRGEPERRQLLERALGTAQAIGMSGLVADATAALAELGGAPSTGVAGSTGGPVSVAPPADVGGRSRIRVLGHFEVVGAGTDEPAHWSSRKARDALKVLVCQRGRPMPREQLVDLLWPDVELAVGRSRLSVVLSMVRGALDPDRRLQIDPLRADRQAVSLDHRVVDIDAERFLEAAARGRSAMRDGRIDEARRLLAAAVDDAASHRALPEDPYADWSVAFRGEVERTYMETVRMLATLADEAGDYEECVEWHTRAVQLDPDDEEASEELVRALKRAGRPRDAQAHLRQRAARLEADGCASG